MNTFCSGILFSGALVHGNKMLSLCRLCVGRFCWGYRFICLPIYFYCNKLFSIFQLNWNCSALDLWAALFILINGIFSIFDILLYLLRIKYIHWMFQMNICWHMVYWYTIYTLYWIGDDLLLSYMTVMSLIKCSHCDLIPASTTSTYLFFFS